MIKEKMARLAGVAALVAVTAAGCASVNYSSPGTLRGVSVKGSKGAEAGQVVTIDTSGYYLFWTIPLCSGDLDWNSAKKSINGGTALFQDQVGYTELQNALLKIAETRNCDLAEVYYNNSDNFYSELVGLFFGSSQMSVSAVLVPRSGASPRAVAK